MWIEFNENHIHDLNLSITRISRSRDAAIVNISEIMLADQTNCIFPESAIKLRQSPFACQIHRKSMASYRQDQVIFGKHRFENS